MRRKYRRQAETMLLPGRLVVIVGLTLILLLIGSSAGFAQEAPSIAGQVRAIEPDELGLTNPAGLAFSPAANLFYVVAASEPGRSPALFSDITTLSASPLISQADTVSALVAIPDPINMAFDGKANRLLLFQPATLELIDIAARPDGQLDSTTLIRHRVPRFGLRNPQGMTVDPASGRLFLLDSIGPRIVRVEPDPDVGFASAAITRLDLVGTNLGGLRGLAFNPANGHLYSLNPSQQTLYELTQAGHIVASHDISSLALGNPQGLVFAPSGDLTDDPSQTSLYIADSGLGAGLDQQATSGTGGQIVEFSFDQVEPSAVTAPTVVASLVQTIDTSAFNPPSPDSAGIAYVEPLGALLMSDSEVDEMPGLFTGDNMFEMTLGGSLLRTGTALPEVTEPSGLAYDPINHRIFIGDDGRRRIWEIHPGPDGLFFTADDPKSFFRTEPFGSTDPEGVAFDTSEEVLFVADGVNLEVYRVHPGDDGVFNGIELGGDDVVTNWDMEIHGATDLEGISYDAESGDLYIVGKPKNDMFHVTTTGTLVRKVDISAANDRRPAGVTLAPGTVDPRVMNLYVADRRVDNDMDPSENDGKVYELYVPAPTADVTLVKTVEPVAAVPGGPITFTLSFQNTGNNTARGVTITDIIPPEVTVQSVYSSGVTVVNSGALPPYVWQVQDMTTSDEGVIVVTGEVSSALSCFDPFVNTATIATTSADARSGNDSSSVALWAGAGVTVDPISDSKTGNQGQNVIYTLRVTNEGSCADTFNVSVSGTDWSVLVQSQVTLAPGAHRDVEVTVQVPSDAPCGPESAIITFTSQQASSVSASSELVTTINPVYGVTVAPPTDTRSGLPGAVVTYTLRMTNTGNCLETFDLSASQPNWITDFPPTVGPLYPGLGLDVDVFATVPPDALATDQDVTTMTFASQGNGAISAHSILTTSVGATAGVDVNPSTATGAGDPNTGVPYTLQVTNTGNQITTFSVSTSSDLWPASAQPTAVTLAPAASAAVVVTVTVPSGAQCGTEDHTTATLTSQSNGSIFASSVLTTSVNTVRSVNALLTGLTGSGDPDSEVYYDLFVRNEGNCTDIIDISVSGATWPVSTKLTEVELPPLGLTTVGVTVTVPPTAQCNADVATVTFTSRNDITAFDSSTLATTANAISEFTLTPSVSTSSGDPGADAAYTLWLTNTGSCQDTFTFSAVGDDWPANAQATAVTLGPDQAAPVQVTVAVPLGAQCGDSDSAVVTFTSQNDGTVSELSLLTTSANPVPALAVTPSSAPGWADPGSAAVYILQVTNLGNCRDTYDFSATGDQWPASAQPSAVTLDPGASADVDVSVIVPSDALCVDNDVATVTFTSREDVGVSDSSTLTTWANAVYGMTVAPSSSSASGDPGAEATHNLMVTNIGNCQDTFTFSASGDDWPASTQSSTVVLDPDQNAPVQVTVAVPSGAQCGDSDRARVTFTSQHDGAVFDRSTLTTTANPVSALTAVPSTDTRSAAPGSDAVYSLWLTNIGNCIDTFTITAVGDTWTASAVPTQVELAPSEGTPVQVTVRVPSSAQCGNDVATVTFTSNDGTASASSTLTTSANAVRGVTVEPSSEALSGNPGDPVVYNLSVTNDGNCADTFNFSASGNAWTTSAPSVGPLGPGASADVDVTVTVHPDALCNEQDIASATFISASDGTTSDSSDLTTTANSVYGVTVAPPSAALSGDPGAGVVYTLWVTNTGNCSDTLLRSISGNSWGMNAPASVGPLNPDAGESIEVTVTVDPCSEGGISDAATVTFASQHDGTAADSASLTTTANNAVPVAGDDLYDATEDVTLVVDALGIPRGVLDDDDDANCTPLAVSQYTQPTNGTVVVDGDGSFTYTPAPNYHGIDTFTYHASDGVHSDMATVSVAVESAYDDPDVNAGPNLPLVGEPSIEEGDTVSFSGTFVDPPPQSPQAEGSIHWDFGDGNTATGTLAPTHTYVDDDEYTVTLTVTDTEGDAGQDSLLVTVLNVPPVVDAGPDKKADPGEVVSFHGSYTDPGDDTHTIRWDLSDGTVIHGAESFDHAFGATGDYTVILTVTDDDGGVGTDTAMVSVRLKMYLPLVFRNSGP